jgi:hypothetical protein
MHHPYGLIFIVFSLLGYIYEAIIGKKHSICGDSLMKMLNICLPLITIYGFGVIILIILRNMFPKMGILRLSILATIVITIYECIVGQMSFLYNKRQTWKYDYPLCKGYISPYVSLVWFVFIYIFYYFMDSYFSNDQ